MERELIFKDNFHLCFSTEEESGIKENK